MSIVGKSPPGIKGKEAIDLIVKALLEEGIDKEVIISMFFLLNNSLKRKITICHKSLFERRLKEICRENKHEMDRGNCRKVADEILNLFYDDPKKKIRTFIKNNHDNITVVAASISAIASIVSIILSLL